MNEENKDLIKKLWSWSMHTGDTLFAEAAEALENKTLDIFKQRVNIDSVVWLSDIEDNANYGHPVLGMTIADNIIFILIAKRTETNKVISYELLHQLAFDHEAFAQTFDYLSMLELEKKRNK